MNNILVIGSMNMDLVVKTSRCPKRGETILGKNFQKIPGGKGANQALAASKLGGKVNFLGGCGRDDFGESLLNNLEQNGVDVGPTVKFDTTTGIASIIIEEDGENRIIVIQGANAELTPDIIEDNSQLIKNSQILLLQLEIPVESVIRAIDLAHKFEVKVILDPAPALQLPEEIFKKIDFLTPNQGELKQLIGGDSLSNTNERARQILALGLDNLLLTRGSDGVVHYTEAGKTEYKALEVEAEDTTAAGDAFTGALAVGLQHEWPLSSSITFANIVGALSVTRLGAQSSLPSRKEVDSFIEERGIVL